MPTSRRQFAPSPFRRRVGASGSSGFRPWQIAWRRRSSNTSSSRSSTQSFWQTRTATDPADRLSMLSGSRASDAGSTDWVLEFDIKGLFDNIDHELLLRAVRKHVTCAWALLYIERWLSAPMLQEDGTMVERSRGTPQGGVVSPILANLFMHYAFDAWMARRFPDLPWCRYADDGLVHCRSETEAQTVREALAARLAECRLELHPTKTKVVYCKDHRRRDKYETVSFDFLGYCFRPRSVKGPGTHGSCSAGSPRRSASQR